MESLLIFALLFLVPSSSAVERRLLIVGGALADDNDDIYGKMVELAGGQGVARIGVVTAASSDPEDSADFYVPQFLSYGAADARWFPVSVDNKEAAFDAEEVLAARDMTGFFFGGGDQSRITESLFIADSTDGGRRAETPLMSAIRQVYEDGTAAVGGTSAGADAITGAVMVLSGQSYEAITNGATASDKPPSNPLDLDLYYDPEGGMGLLPGIAIDTHFSQRGRQGRMLRLLSDTLLGNDIGTPFGLGVDEDTSLVVTWDTEDDSIEGEVLGTNGVYFADISVATVRVDTEGVWSLDGASAHYLNEGDRIDLRRWEAASFAGESTLGRERHGDAATTGAVFAGNPDGEDLPGEYARIAGHLADSTESETFGATAKSSPSVYVVTLDEIAFGDAFSASSFYRRGEEGSEDQYRVSYQSMGVDIGPDEG